MSNERKDEFLSWRGRLDSPDGVPGQGLDDREHTWQRLTNRLSRKPRRRLSVYGIVAACLLLAVIPASRLFHDRHLSSGPGGAEKVSPLVVLPDGGRKIFSSPTPITAAAPGEKLAARVGHPDGGTTKRPGKGRQKANPGIPLEMKTVAVADDSVHIPGAAGPLAIPAAPVVAQLPSTKPPLKWKVVDLNELGSSWRPPQSSASASFPGSLHIGPGRPEPVPAGGSLPEKPALRIKLSP